MAEWIRPSWDDYFIHIAHAVSIRAACTHRQVGAVIVDEFHHQVGSGYNGAPPGEVECTDGGCPRGFLVRGEDNLYADCIAVHAEWNAMLDAGRRNCRGAVLYVSDIPCHICVKLAKGAGIAAMVWDNGNGLRTSILSNELLESARNELGVRKPDSEHGLHP